MDVVNEKRVDQRYGECNVWRWWTAWRMRSVRFIVIRQVSLLLCRWRWQTLQRMRFNRATARAGREATPVKSYVRN